MKLFGNIQEGDTLYCVEVKDSTIQERHRQVVFKKKVTRVIRNTDPTRTSIGVGSDFFTVDAHTNLHVEKKDIQDEVNLSFNAYSTVKHVCVDAAMELIYDRLKILDMIKKRCSESETALLIADSLLENVNTDEEEEMTEEFAEAALG